ncbi:hypothetical protein [Nocardioides sp. WS12]|uniref:hypothetical protein n=1 Tax=Nocardioides sp. WS12 TaxID=2486272 RepID=UPI0015FAB237|nr:hypothetical protein [Nocardioides sp. WS12]
MKAIITPEFITEVESIWAATQRANLDYRLHPFSRGEHSGVCAAQGCEYGLRMFRGRGAA